MRRNNKDQDRTGNRIPGERAICRAKSGGTVNLWENRANAERSRRRIKETKNIRRGTNAERVGQRKKDRQENEDKKYKLGR